VLAGNVELMKQAWDTGALAVRPGTSRNKEHIHYSELSTPQAHRAVARARIATRVRRPRQATRLSPCLTP